MISQSFDYIATIILRLSSNISLLLSDINWVDWKFVFNVDDSSTTMCPVAIFVIKIITVGEFTN